MKIFRKRNLEKRLNVDPDVIPLSFSIEFDKFNIITFELSKKSDTTFIVHKDMCEYLIEREIFFWLTASEIQEAFGEIEIPEKYILYSDGSSDPYYYVFGCPKDEKDINELTNLIKNFIVNGIEKCVKLNKEKELKLVSCDDDECLIYSDEESFDRVISKNRFMI